MKLVRVENTNFKSIDHAVVEELASINILFGPTNSGKTSLMESLFFQFHHRRISTPVKYFEFLHSKADPRHATLIVRTDWVLDEPMADVNLQVEDGLRFVTTITFTKEEPHAEDQLFINDKLEENEERAKAIFKHLEATIKLSSSRRPGDSKQIYFGAPGEETSEERKRRFLNSLHELALQGDQYQEFLTHLQRMFPHLVYGPSSEETIVEFFGMGFLSTAKLFAYLFDARYALVLIDEPEVHFYPSLSHRFVQVLHEVVKELNKQIIISTHSSLFLHERSLGNFYHFAKSSHFLTSARRVEQHNLLQGLDVLNAPPEAVLQSDLIVYVEGPWDIGVMEEFVSKFPELNYVNVVVLQLGGGSMANENVDPVKLKQHNPLSFVIVDSERKSAKGAPDPSHQAFMDRCYQAKLYCLMLTHRAMENYLTPRALRATFPGKVPNTFQPDPYQLLGKQLRWYEKELNRRVAHEMTREEIESFPDLKGFFTELIKVSKQVQ